MQSYTGLFLNHYTILLKVYIIPTFSNKTPYPFQNTLLKLFINKILLI